MSDRRRHHPDLPVRDTHPGSAALNVEAVGLVALGAGFLGSGVSSPLGSA
jgi:hypothetical protein